MGDSPWQALETGRLASAAIAGSTEAFGELTRRYLVAIRGIAFAILGDREAAEDVTQDAFLIAYRSLDQLREPERFPHWVYAIARHRANRLLRMEKKRTLIPLQEGEPKILAATQSISDPSVEMDRKETASLLRSALAGIHPEYREVLELRYWRGLRVRTISEVLGIPESTVKWRLHKGKEVVAEIVREKGDWP